MKLEHYQKFRMIFKWTFLFCSITLLLLIYATQIPNAPNAKRQIEPIIVKEEDIKDPLISPEETLSIAMVKMYNSAKQQPIYTEEYIHYQIQTALKELHYYNHTLISRFGDFIEDSFHTHPYQKIRSYPNSSDPSAINPVVVTYLSELVLSQSSLLNLFIHRSINNKQFIQLTGFLSDLRADLAECKAELTKYRKRVVKGLAIKHLETGYVIEASQIMAIKMRKIFDWVLFEKQACFRNTLNQIQHLH
ncbi:hypothetical protein FGO68_gene12000 [Halteria grandinella]|uniref:Uncharacterized protein n=1 Tax=Halteria grandinella TaxID=5974 RepID=A0A8J8P1M7_HALGN|nr:hypothetical protein FGO68_gene12000 [Halteria grandinella]